MTNEQMSALLDMRGGTPEDWWKVGFPYDSSSGNPENLLVRWEMSSSHWGADGEES